MPVRPPPCRYHCPACHWQKTVAPTRDALTPGVDFFNACPQCGHKPLTATAWKSPAPGAGQLLQALSDWLKR
jgi:hypothetical protein